MFLSLSLSLSLSIIKLVCDDDNSLVPDCWMSLTDFFSFIKPSLSCARACKKTFYQLTEKESIVIVIVTTSCIGSIKISVCCSTNGDINCAPPVWATRNRNPQLRDNLAYCDVSTLKRYCDNLAYCELLAIFKR